MAPAAPALLGIVGPTASGKTDLALALARELRVEILVADSRQVYRGMDIGTAKPDAAAQAAVPHHLLDLVDPDEPFTVAQWVAAARRLIPEIAARGALPLVVGGSGLYVTSLTDGHDYDAQAWSPEVRARLSERLAVDGLEALAERLGTLAPAVAARTDLRNPRRVVRALERAESGDGGALPRAEPYRGHVALLGLDRPRDVIVARIEARAQRLWESGLLDEVRTLLDAGFGPQLEPMTGHGYREAARHLAGEWSRDEALETMVRRTRQYAKRQMTWFRRDARITWLDAGDGPADDTALVARAAAAARALLG
ncbi:MAG: tRNA (adenosine(37)-N6)-dimethylallyltransferase MiaA [Chloroflexota bacterium]